MPTLSEQQAIQFERNLRAVINSFQAGIIATARSGELFTKNAADRIKYAPQLYEGIISALNSSGYIDIVQDLIARDAELIKEIRSLRTAKGLPTAFTNTSRETLEAFQRLELSQFTSIGEGFANSLHQQLMSLAIGGISERDFIANISAKLDSGFKRYATTYAETSRAKFIQQVEDEAAKSYDGELYWEYVGAIDDRNRDACIEGLEIQYFTDAERADFEAQTADERLWNCRHTFVQITKEAYEEGTGNVIDTKTDIQAQEQPQTTDTINIEGQEYSRADVETADKFIDLAQKHGIGTVPDDMPAEVLTEMSNWEYISQSPYSYSYYDKPGKSWDVTPAESIRIADHWNFESQGKIHCRTNIMPPDGTYTIAKYNADAKTYEVLASYKKYKDESTNIIHSLWTDWQKNVTKIDVGTKKMQILKPTIDFKTYAKERITKLQEVLNATKIR